MRETKLHRTELGKQSFLLDVEVYYKIDTDNSLYLDVLEVEGLPVEVFSCAFINSLKDEIVRDMEEENPELNK